MKGGDEFTGCGEIEGKTRQWLRSPDIQKRDGGGGCAQAEVDSWCRTVQFWKNLSGVFIPESLSETIQF